MIYSLFLVGVIAAIVFWYKRWHKLPKEQRGKFRKQSLIWLLVILIIGLVAAGRAHWLMGVLAALLVLMGRVAQFAQYVPFFKRMYDDVNAHAGQRGPNSGNQGTANNNGMTRQQAADLLGVAIDASDEEIRLAHKKLMQKIHPDRGGSDALAKQINLAKDVMLK